MSLSRAQQSVILAAIRSQSLKLHLYTSNPTASDTGTEVSGGSYAAATITFGAPAVNGNGTEILNDILVSFPAATADWSAPITHFGVRVSGGALIAYGELTESNVATQRQVRTGDVFRAPIGTVMIRIPD